MANTLFIVLFSTAILSCNTSTTNDGFIKESVSLNKIVDEPGEFLLTIPFAVQTDNKKDFEDGLIPWVNIENPQNDIPQLVDRSKTVIEKNKITVVIDYPLENIYTFDLESPDGFTREELILEISKNYHKIYEEEEKTATVKTLPMEQRKIQNRNETNGKYGIWGHDISDLDLSGISVYKRKDGQLIVLLGVES